MSPRPTFREGVKVRFVDQIVTVVRTRFNATGREWVDIRFLVGPHAGMTTTAPAAVLLPLAEAMPTRMPTLPDGELA